MQSVYPADHMFFNKSFPGYLSFEEFNQVLHVVHVLMSEGMYSLVVPYLEPYEYIECRSTTESIIHTTTIRIELIQNGYVQRFTYDYPCKGSPNILKWRSHEANDRSRGSPQGYREIYNSREELKLFNKGDYRGYMDLVTKHNREDERIGGLIRDARKKF